MTAIDQSYPRCRISGVRNFHVTQSLKNSWTVSTTTRRIPTDRKCIRHWNPSDVVQLHSGTDIVDSAIRGRVLHGSFSQLALADMLKYRWAWVVCRRNSTGRCSTRCSGASADKLRQITNGSVLMATLEPTGYIALTEPFICAHIQERHVRERCVNIFFRNNLSWYVCNEQTK